MSLKKSQGFTLIELLTVMTVIAILASLILATAGYARNKAARSRAEAEIIALTAACENYKTDNGSYPRGPATALTTPTIAADTTDKLDARADGNPQAAKYTDASLYLYVELSGDTNANGKIDPTEGKSYFEFKPAMLSGTKDANGIITAVKYIQDPFGFSYGYSTAYQADATKGYNPTFDLWRTAAGTAKKSGETEDQYRLRWVKNW